MPWQHRPIWLSDARAGSMTVPPCSSILRITSGIGDGFNKARHPPPDPLDKDGIGGNKRPGTVRSKDNGVEHSGMKAQN